MYLRLLVNLCVTRTKRPMPDCLTMQKEWSQNRFQEWCSRGLPGEQLFAKPAEVMAQARERLASTLTRGLHFGLVFGENLSHTGKLECLVHRFVQEQHGLAGPLRCQMKRGGQVDKDNLDLPHENFLDAALTSSRLVKCCKFEIVHFLFFHTFSIL